MAWQTIGTTEVKQTSTVLGYVYLQYDDSSSGSNWNVRLITGARSGYSFNVRFDNVTVDGNNQGSKSNVTQNSVTVWSGSLSGGRGISGSWSCPWNTGTKSYTISGTLPSKGTAPSGPFITYNSSTWNSVTFTTGVTNTGGLALQNHAIVITGSSNGDAVNYTTFDNAPRWEWMYDGTMNASHQFVATQATSGQNFSNPITMKGLLNYKLGCWIENTIGSTWKIDGNLRYLPPSPLQSIAYTQTQNSTNVTVNITITGGTSANNYSDSVTTYYRYSTNGGSSYTGWTSAGTGSTWTAKTASFNCNYGASVVVQAKQTFHNMDSEVKQISFTATTGTAPSGGIINVTGSTWNSISLAASGVSYGKPDGINGRKIAVGVGDGYQQRNYKRENQFYNVTSANTTVDNNSVYPSAQPLQLKGMLPVYPYVWAWNTVTAADAYWGQVYYLPPAPGVGSYEETSSGNYTVTYTGVSANNYANYDILDLTRTVRYKLAGAPDWTYVDNDAQKPINANTTFNLTLLGGTSAVVEAWLTYKGKNSEVTTFTISNSSDPVGLYGSVNGQTKAINKLYGPVNGVSKKIVKLYGSVDGVARLVFEDSSS